MRFQICVLLLLFSTAAIAKPRFVNFHDEMKYAKFVGEVIIDGYDSVGARENRIRFHSTEFTDTIRSAGTKGCPGGYFNDSTEIGEKYGTDYWPREKEKVIVVIDSTNNVSLFAVESGADYRFWSPYFTMSVACFEIEPPVKRLEGQYNDRNEHAGTSWDGCLLPKELLRTYGHE